MLKQKKIKSHHAVQAPNHYAALLTQIGWAF